MKEAETCPACGEPVSPSDPSAIRKPAAHFHRACHLEMLAQPEPSPRARPGVWARVPGYPSYEFREPGELRCWRIGGEGERLASPVLKTPMLVDGLPRYRLFTERGHGEWHTIDEVRALMATREAEVA